MFFLLSLFGGAVGTLAIVKALFLVNFKALTIVVLLQKLQPVFAITLAALLLGEKLKRNFLLWSALAITAGYFLHLVSDCLIWKQVVIQPWLPAFHYWQLLLSAVQPFSVKKCSESTVFLLQHFTVMHSPA